MAISHKELQVAVGEELGLFLGQQFLSLQKEISGKFESLQDLAVRVVEKSLEKHELPNMVEASQEEEMTTVAYFSDEILPVCGDVVPKSMPHCVSEELEILDTGIAGHAYTDCKQEATPSSVVPTADAKTTTRFQSRANSGSVISPPPLLQQAPTQASMAASMSKTRTSASRKSSRATEIWKYAARASVSPSVHVTIEEEKPQDFMEDLMEVVKAAVFSDPGGMKEKMRSEMLHPTIKVSSMYKETGLAQRIARSDWFEIITFVVIFSNILWMAVDLDMNGAKTLLDAHVVFIVMDNFFCLYFFIELLIRFAAFKRKRDCLSDPWFCLDTAIVILMIVETWIMTIVFWVLDGGPRKDFDRYGDASLLRVFRIVRLTKITRVAKLFHLFPELVTMVRGFKFAARTVFLCFCLVINVIYVSALVFREFTLDQEIGNKYFNSVPGSMITLLFQGTMPDVEPFIQDIAKGRMVVGVFGVIFIFLTTFTLMNMLVGVIVGVVSEIADAEKERRTVAFVKKELQKVFSCPEIDLDFDGTISEEEFETLLTHPLAIQALSTVGVDAIGLVDVSDFIFSRDSDEKLSFSEFVELILNLRGSNTATVKDIIDLRMFLTSEFLQVEKKMAKQMQQLTQVCHERAMGSEVSIASLKSLPSAPQSPKKVQRPQPPSACPMPLA